MFALLAPLAAVPAAAQAASGEVVPMSTALAACINIETGQPEATPIYKERLAALTQLTCRSSSGVAVDSLRGLEAATGLIRLTVEGTDKADGDLRPLSRLTTLRELESNAFHITNLAPVAGLGLTRLDLAREPLTDARDVALLTKLQTLQILLTPISSPPDLRALTRLENLSLRRNSLTTPPDLSGKPALKLVDLSGNSLTALPSFAGAPAVSSLSIGSNQISDLTPLAGLSSLRTLSAPLNRIIDLRPLAPLLLTALDVKYQRASLPAVIATTPSTLPALSGPTGTSVAVDITEFSPIEGTVIDGVVRWARPGTGLLAWDGTVAFFGGATRFSGQMSQSVVLGTLTTGSPSVSAKPAVGTAVTASAGTWGPSPVNLKFQWLRNGQVITGATSSSYSPVTADGGQKLSVRVYGSKAGYAQASRTSAETAAVLKKITTAKPTIVGTATVGSILTAKPGTWTPSTVTHAVQWNRNGAAITGATATTYTVTAADAGSTITVTVTGSAAGYATASVGSAATTIVTGGTLSTTTPTITGSAVVGQKLIAAAGTWGPTPVTLGYQWRRGGAAIPGATGSSYTLTGADLGAAVTVTVTGTKVGFTTASKTSAATSAVKGLLGPAPAPTINGTMITGSTLAATAGTWGPGAVTVTFQWNRDGVAIPGATGATYALTAADAGSSITVTTRGSKPGYEPATRSSAATPTIGAAVLEGPQPTITGPAVVGTTLTGKSGVWAPAPVTLAYQWSRDGVAIPGAV
ncbi:MAG: hypothetical protein Q7T71_20780, partial [Herbiconiux sp.]|nr:hypothetical protein [Herbiconiux sp.]